MADHGHAQELVKSAMSQGQSTGRTVFGDLGDEVLDRRLFLILRGERLENEVAKEASIGDTK